MTHFQIEEDQNIIYTKTGCPHCEKAKILLGSKGISFIERDIMQSSLFKRQLLLLMQDKIEREEPITTPQIWLQGKYIGGEDELEEYFTS